ncbi:hypothetical protein [Rhodohalobacter sulfatireducens]|uniref:Uncharacterized protein n=1 Tax=Rhodohalobacter sulfatireducens TaxID=2911366 RepID=A0ABS9K9Q2_9BACT|nr:hypothetical protein [Rhodohalobacter sulfatireducens]MCG2587576.1 hypothetical protein [Rhodohalobacter sulfatireducens]MDR9366985.1 hypothetical protein [Balneolaceae bacterium]MDR9410289.1 hypothetical protein [Balneolaceae bacterium]
MDIFKLIFEHDLRLDELRERHLDRSSQEVSASIEDFMKPDPTYSKFYISGTVLNRKTFGLDRIKHFPQVMDSLSKALNGFNIFLDDTPVELQNAVKEAEIGWPILLSENNEIEWDPEMLVIDDESNVGHKKSELAQVLKSGDLVLYKEKAHQGFDLHLFSQDNIYPKLFYPLRELVNEEFRFFSINGKRIRSERQFYFETWALHQPPHGVEEVYTDTEI